MTQGTAKLSAFGGTAGIDNRDTVRSGSGDFPRRNCGGKQVRVHEDSVLGRPMHLFGHNFDHDYYFELLPEGGAGQLKVARAPAGRV